MDKTTASKFVECIRDSLQNDPNQFSIQVAVTGQKVVSHGGTGLSISARGGGPGSNTIGQQVSVGGGQIEIATGKANAAMQEQIQSLVETLDQIVDQLHSDEPDSGAITRLYKSLMSTWVPGVITSVLGNALSAWVLL